MSSHLSARLPAVDALRALAVIPVIVFHLHADFLPGGYLGVDIFFVISGFLISGIIFRQIANGTFSLRAFYARRVRRILPALFVMMACVVLLFAWADPLNLNELVHQANMVLGLVGNINARELAGDYWGAGAQAQPLLHTWSLGVEEQFYLGFPLLLWLLHRCVAPARRKWLLGSLTAVSLTWYVAQSYITPPAAFYLLAGRAWELLAGALVAVWTLERRDDECSPGWVSWMGLALIGLAYVLPAISPEARPLLPLLAVAGTALFLSSAGGRPPAHVWLSRPWFVYIGLISYSLYLWHWPVIVLLRKLDPGALSSLWSTAVVSVGIFLTAAASYQFVEQPLRSARLTVAGVMVCIPLFLFGGQMLVQAYGRTVILAAAAPQHNSADARVGGFRRMTVKGLLYDSHPRSTLPASDKYRALEIIRPARAPAIAAVQIGGEPGSAKRVVVWGDSHAMTLAPLADDVLRTAHYSAAFHVLDGYDPAVWRQRRAGTQPIFQLLRRVFRDGRLVTSDELDQYEKAGLELLQAQPAACVFVMRYDGRKFETLEASFAEILRHTRLIFVQQPPTLTIPDLCTVDYFAFLRDRRGVALEGLAVYESPSDREAKAQFEAKLLARFGGRANFVFLKTADLFTRPDGAVRWSDGSGTLYYIDGNHLSEFGCELLRPLMEAALR
ncbi:MAG: hypothetical protein RL759_157 [Verrucomicrobiota bacterium]|jgi:peptidoglycan/LPS O-acetylase OafA/YrhL